MSQQILQLTLSENEQQLYMLRNCDERFIIQRYDIETRQNKELYVTDQPIASFIVCANSMLFIEQGDLMELQLNTLQVHSKKQVNSISSFNESSYTYEREADLFIQSLETNEEQLIASNVQQVIPSKGPFVMYRKDDRLFAFVRGEHIVISLDFVESAALSLDEKYIAIFAYENGERHFYVYDLTLRILQNMTAMLGDPIGYNGPKLLQTVTEMPIWTETNAFYFLVTANEEVRLYYGDLYGTLLPASPEEQLIYTYAVAKSGNWAFTALTSGQLLFLNITDGNILEITV